MPGSNHKVFNIVLALVISVVAWTYVVYNYEPTTDVRYKDIPVVFTGEEDLADRGFGVVSVDTETIDVVLNQKRVSTSDISENNIIVTADVSEASEGDNSVGLTISGPDGTNVTESSKRSVKVTVEKTDRIDAEVLIAYQDAGELGAEPITEKLTSTGATVIGAESTLKSVDKVVAFLAFGDASADFRTFTRELKAVDSQGNVIPHVVIYPNNVNFSAKLGYTKKVSVKVKTTGGEDDYYTRTYTAPETIVIKGDQDAISKINKIETEEIDLSGYYEDGETELEYVLPEGVYLANESLDDNLMKIKVSKTEPKDEQEEETQHD
jgi:YbbR domain-containing protein